MTISNQFAVKAAPIVAATIGAHRATLLLAELAGLEETSPSLRAAFERLTAELAPEVLLELETSAVDPIPPDEMVMRDGGPLLDRATGTEEYGTKAAAAAALRGVGRSIDEARLACDAAGLPSIAVALESTGHQIHRFAEGVTAQAGT